MKKYILALLCLTASLSFADWLDNISNIVIEQNRWNTKAIKQIVETEIAENSNLINELNSELDSKQNIFGFLSKAAIQAELLKIKAEKQVHLRVLKNLDKISQSTKQQSQLINLFKEIQEINNKIKARDSKIGLLNLAKIQTYKANILFKKRYIKTLLEI